MSYRSNPLTSTHCISPGPPHKHGCQTDHTNHDVGHLRAIVVKNTRRETQSPANKTSARHRHLPIHCTPPHPSPHVLAKPCLLRGGGGVCIQIRTKCNGILQFRCWQNNMERVRRRVSLCPFQAHWQRLPAMSPFPPRARQQLLHLGSPLLCQ